MLKTDTAKWTQALEMLFESCVPLTYHLTKEDVNNIQLKVLYCMHVRCCIEDGIEAISWEAWNVQRENLSLNYKLETIDTKGFQKDLMKAFERG